LARWKERGKERRTHAFEVEIIDTTNKKVFFMLNLFSFEAEPAEFYAIASSEAKKQESKVKR
jgi:hypothetical protein